MRDPAVVVNRAIADVHAEAAEDVPKRLFDEINVRPIISNDEVPTPARSGVWCQHDDAVLIRLVLEHGLDLSAVCTRAVKHHDERGFFARLPHTEVGVQTHAGIPWRFTNAPNCVRTPAPLLGADTDAVMHDLLGYSAQEIARLKEEQVLY